MENKRNNTKYVSIAELAKMLGISRVAVYKKVKKGQVPAVQIGRSYAISMEDVNEMLQNSNSILTEDKKKEINKAVEKVVAEYGETLRLLGKE